MITREQLLAAINERQEMQRIIDDASAALDAKTDIIKAYMNDAGIDEFTIGPFRVTWRESKPRMTIDADALKADGLYDKYCKTVKGTRPFRVS